MNPRRASPRLLQNKGWRVMEGRVCRGERVYGSQFDTLIRAAGDCMRHRSRHDARMARSHEVSRAAPDADARASGSATRSCAMCLRLFDMVSQKAGFGGPLQPGLRHGEEVIGIRFQAPDTRRSVRNKHAPRRYGLSVLFPCEAACCSSLRRLSRKSVSLSSLS